MGWGNLYPFALEIYVVCRIKLKGGKIASMDEHWADDGEAPKWRQDMKIGRKIK